MRTLIPLFLIALLAVPATAQAAENSGAYTAGRIFGYLIIAALVVLLFRWVFKKIRA